MHNQLLHLIVADRVGERLGVGSGATVAGPVMKQHRIQELMAEGQARLTMTPRGDCFVQ